MEINKNILKEKTNHKGKQNTDQEFLNLRLFSSLEVWLESDEKDLDATAHPLNCT